MDSCVFKIFTQTGMLQAVIAVKFARLEHIRYLLNGGSAGYIFIHHYYFNLNQCTVTISCKVGAGLHDLANKAEI